MGLIKVYDIPRSCRILAFPSRLNNRGSEALEQAFFDGSYITKDPPSVVEFTIDELCIVRLRGWTEDFNFEWDLEAVKDYNLYVPPRPLLHTTEKYE